MSESLEPLLADGVIDAIIGQLKTGKEAEVWLVQHADQVVAAKVYKERHARNFRNNVGYREGREVRNSRTRRAMEKGSRFGQAASEDAWKSAESDSLYTLHAQGVRVPTPVMFYEGVLLMELVLDAEGHPAPRLVEAPPATPEEARALYADLRAQVVRMLCADLIHGDLSPYNILMSGRGAVIIDFPQTVAAARNNRAEFYFRRDLDNVRNFLAGIDPGLYAAAGETGEIWNAYVRRDLTPDFTPSGAFREAPRRQGPPGRHGDAGPREPRHGARPERPGGHGRRPDFHAEPPAQALAPAVAEDPSISKEEAELRALEALVLRQGGGERGKPAASPPPRDGRRRGPGGRPPPRSGGNGRPPMSGQRAGGAPRPPGGPARPPAGDPRGPNPPGAPRAGGHPPRQPHGEPRGASHSQPPQGEQRAGGHPPRQPHGEQRGGGHPPRQPHGEHRTGGHPPRQPHGEHRAGSHQPRQPHGEQRVGGHPPRQPHGEQRGGGHSAPPHGEQRGAHHARPPMGEPRGEAHPHTPQGEPRRGAHSRPPMGERRGGSGRPPPAVETRPVQAATEGHREHRSSGPGTGPGPRKQRPPSERGAPRGPRSGPQVSYVGRSASTPPPRGPHESGA
jgi:RIO kinase 1